MPDSLINKEEIKSSWQNVSQPLRRVQHYTTSTGGKLQFLPETFYLISRCYYNLYTMFNTQKIKLRIRHEDEILMIRVIFLILLLNIWQITIWVVFNKDSEHWKQVSFKFCHVFNKQTLSWHSTLSKDNFVLISTKTFKMLNFEVWVVTYLLRVYSQIQVSPNERIPYT